MSMLYLRTTPHARVLVIHENFSGYVRGPHKLKVRNNTVSVCEDIAKR